jgi:excisionase family DNA binding protein
MQESSNPVEKPIEKIFLRPSEVIKATGLSRGEVYKRIATGEIPSLRFGKAICVPIRALQSLAEGSAN